MTEILNWSDIETIEDEAIKNYMLYTKQRATKQQKPWDFKNWGYWIIIDTWEELEKPLIGIHFTLPTIQQGLLNQIEIYEEKFGVVELVFLLNNDFGISLVLKEKTIPEFEHQALKAYKYIKETSSLLT